MKKNLITVIIFALCVVNLILNAVLLFVGLPSASKTNRLITQIASVLQLELEADQTLETERKVDLEDVSYFVVEEQIINLKADGTDEVHFAQVGLNIGLDKSAKKKEYETLLAVLQEGEGAVFDEARKVIQRYTKEEIADLEIQESVKKEILKNLQEKFQTDCIYSVSFSKFTLQ